MDGVIADFEQPNNQLVRAYGLAPVKDRQEFYYAETYRDYPKLLAMIYKENRRPGFFINFPMIEGTVEGWQRIIDAGYVPRICSSPLENHPTVIAEKKAWLEEHLASVFGPWVVDTAIFDRDKTKYTAIALIDDRPGLRGVASWPQIVFNQSYNQDIITPLRLNGWKDSNFVELLKMAEVQCGA
jgi:5'-nucleotidase